MPRGNYTKRVECDAVLAHVDALQAKYPSIADRHIGMMAGIGEGQISKVRRTRGLVTADTESRVLAVQESHIALMPPRWVPSEPTRRHVIMLLAVPGSGTVQVGAAAGVSPDTVRNTAAGKYPKILTTTAARLRNVTPAMVTGTRPLKDAGPSTTRLRALQANGWPINALIAMMGLPWCRVSEGRYIYVHESTEAAILALYRRIGDTPGPSNRARTEAKKAGYLTPIHYDDDMNAVVVPKAAGKYTQDDARFWLCVLAHSIRGERPLEVSNRLGGKVKANGIGHIRDRAGLRMEKPTDQDVRPTPSPGQEILLAGIAEAIEGIDLTEVTDVLDDADIDYLARWQIVKAAQAEQAAQDEEGEEAA